MSKNNFVDLAIEDNLATKAELSGAALDAPSPTPGGNHDLPPETPPVTPFAPEMQPPADSPELELPAGFDLSDQNLEKLEYAFAQKRPSAWNITPFEGDLITATHIENRAVFVGTIKEFNILLRG